MSLQPLIAAMNDIAFIHPTVEKFKTGDVTMQIWPYPSIISQS